MAKLELSGKTFGLWTVLHETPRPIGKKELGVFWLCRCSCGTEQPISAGRLSAGRCQSGCELCRSHRATVGGMTPEYQSWRGMRERCLNPKHVSYDRYGGRGIKVCDQWVHSFSQFLIDMGMRPIGHSLDRIDFNGDYSPTNCRWADTSTQRRNSSTFRLADEQVSAICNLLAAGARQIDIAQAIGVARSHIANIATGHSRAFQKGSPKAAEIRRIMQERG